MGKSGSGKLSMRNMIFLNYSAIDTRRLGATIDVERTQIRLLNNLNMLLMDCGGQEHNMRKYITDGRARFMNVELLIYVFDIGQTEENDFSIFNLILKQLKELSPKCKIFILTHKMDLVNEDERELVMAAFQDNLRRYAVFLKFFAEKDHVQYAATSIWDESLYKAWSAVIGSLIPQTQLLQKNLKGLASIVNAEFVMIFEKLTFLKIATYPQYTDKSKQDDLESITQKVSGIIKNFKKSVEKISARFDTLTLYSDSKNIYFDSLTENMVIMIVAGDNEVDKKDGLPEQVKASEEAYVHYVVKKARKAFEKIDFGSE